MSFCVNPPGLGVASDLSGSAYPLDVFMALGGPTTGPVGLSAPGPSQIHR